MKRPKLLALFTAMALLPITLTSAHAQWTASEVGGGNTFPERKLSSLRVTILDRNTGNAAVVNYWCKKNTGKSEMLLSSVGDEQNLYIFDSSGITTVTADKYVFERGYKVAATQDSDSTFIQFEVPVNGGFCIINRDTQDGGSPKKDTFDVTVMAAIAITDTNEASVRPTDNTGSAVGR